MTKIAPSILAADPLRMFDAVKLVKDTGCDELHFDVMDGHFVPNISYGAPVLTCLHAALPDVFYDVHLMISDPARYAADFAKAGADLITFHLEAVPDTVEEVIAAIRAMNQQFRIPEGFSCIREEDLPQMAAWADAEANPTYPVPVIYDRAHFIRVIRRVMLPAKREEQTP